MKITYSEAHEVAVEAPVGVADFLLGINASLAQQSARIEGEVTSIKDSYPTAVYFTIKDTSRDALLNCVIWRTIYNQNGVYLKEGDAIIVSGTPEIYAARGTFSLKVQTIEYAGEGQLKRAYDELRLKLSQEGLLDSVHKRQLPAHASRIGVITSRSGVVIQDFSANLGRYGFTVTLVDARVEGKAAVPELLAALATLAKADIEILVIMRGGGSWESLQAFNTESVVRAIAAFPAPVLTGIGHDVDVTLAELVADVGASTPTAVAQRLNESWDTLAAALQTAGARVSTQFARTVALRARTIEQASLGLPRLYQRRLTEVSQAIVRLEAGTQTVFRHLKQRILLATAGGSEVVRVMRRQLTMQLKVLEQLPSQLSRLMQTKTTIATKTITTMANGICRIQRANLATEATRLASLEQLIKVADPAHTLRLGYSLTYQNGKVLRSISAINPGEPVTTTLADGVFTSTIQTIQ